MSLAAIWAWVTANQASLATILLIVSEFLGANSKVRSNGFLSFLLIRLKELSKKSGGVDPTPNT
jgi:hypothetical protein